MSVSSHKGPALADIASLIGTTQFRVMDRPRGWVGRLFGVMRPDAVE